MAKGPAGASGSFDYTYATSGWTPANYPTLTAADINNDGHTDLWATTTSGVKCLPPQHQYHSHRTDHHQHTSGIRYGSGRPCWNAFKTVTGDVNGDHRTDAAILYHHTDGSTTAHVAFADANGHLGAFSPSFTIPASAFWDWNAVALLGPSA